jgi:hypothetical protein
MNLHEIGADNLIIEYLRHRFRGYDFIQTGPREILYAYTTEHPRWLLMDEGNYDNYLRNAQTWEHNNKPRLR